MYVCPISNGLRDRAISLHSSKTVDNKEILRTLSNTGVSWDNSVGIATIYWLDDRGVGVRVLVGSRIFTSPCRPDRLWVPPNLLSNRYRGLYPRGKAAGV
jgi:hypothetical protein